MLGSQMAAAEDSSKYQCLICGKSYSTKSHLRRHETLHISSASLKCPFCDQKFRRIDALRRHSRTCPEKGQHEPIPIAKRGRKPQACDICRARKIRCDGCQPCRKCLSRKVACSYGGSRLASPSMNSSIPVAHGGSTKSHPTPVFLLGFTNPARNWITDAFGIKELAHDEASEATPDHTLEYYEPLSHVFEWTFESLFPGISSDFCAPLDAAIDNPEIFSISLCETSTLEKRISQLLAELNAQQKRGVASLGTPLEFSETLARKVFTVKNLLKYVSSYFNHVDSFFPLIHRPTFDIETASLPLILAIALSGSVYSGPEHEFLLARKFFRVGEEYVFGLLDEAVANCDPDEEQRNTEILQSALLLQQLLSACNDARTRRRIEATRHPVLVSAARTLHLMGARRTTCLGHPDWKRFIIEESRVRLMMWIYCADCMSALLFNSRPQITIAEMTGDMPCQSDLFEAATDADFNMLAAAQSSSTRKLPCIRDWITSLLHETWAGPEESRFWGIELMHLHMAIVALHSIIFVARGSLMLPSSTPLLLRATNRWKELWDYTHASLLIDAGRPTGFAKYAPEIWSLARTIIQVAHAGDLRSRYMQGAPTGTLADLHEFIRLYELGAE